MTKKRGQTLAMDVVFDLAASFLLGIGTYSFIEPANIAPGGVSGISLMIKYLWNVPIGVMNIVINIPLLCLSYRYLGRQLTIHSLRTLLISSMILDGVVTPFFPQYTGDRMLGTIYGGVLLGTALGLIFSRGGTTGGTDIISYLLERRYPHISIGQLMMMMDGIVIGISVFVFQDLEAALFAVITLFCQTKVINGLVYGRDKGTVVSIISKKSKEIKDAILQDLERGVTILKGQGAYSGEDRDMLYCVVRIQEFPAVKKLVYEIDEKAFLIVQEATKVHGEGFKKLE